MYKLREIARKDIITINKWRNNDKLISNLGAPFRYINEEVDNNWYDNYMKNRANSVRCAITDEDDEIIGLISLVSIDYLNQSGELHIMIGDEKNQGKGIGLFAVKEMINHAFNNLNLHRIELSVLDSNIHAKKLYEKAGFKYEGTKKHAKYKNGKFIDMLIYAILKEEF